MGDVSEPPQPGGEGHYAASRNRQAGTCRHKQLQHLLRVLVGQGALPSQSMRSCIPLQNRLGEIHDALHMLNSRQREEEEVEQSRAPKRRRDRSPSPPDTTTPLSNMLQPLSQATSTQVQPTSSPAQVFDGPITRS
jgi:hypothetical protein